MQPKQVRNPEQTSARILAAATHEFAAKGLGGARVDNIAARAKVQKRMLYHYFGNKDDLFRTVLEAVYAQFREAEAALELEKLPPIAAVKRLLSFTWEYYIAHPEFITLVNSENLHRARHLKASRKLKQLNRAFVQRMQNLLDRGVNDGLFRSGIDAVQLLITISGVGYHYLTNQFTGEIVYGRKLTTKAALSQRLSFNTDTILRLVCKEGAI